MNEQVVPIRTLHLFPVLHGMLMELLASLTPDQWQCPTVARLWTVKDVAAHLLDVNVRTIAEMQGFEPPPPAKPVTTYRDLVDHLNELNATWVNAMKRVSPQLLLQMMEVTGQQHIEYLNSLDPFAPAKYPVAWAGEETSLNWFHIAREYTEKWHHQQQIRDALGIPGLMARELFYPCIATFMYALPYTYRTVNAAIGAVIRISIGGEDWYLHKLRDGWKLTTSSPDQTPVATIVLPPDIAWKLFTKAIPGQTAMQKSIVTGDKNLAAGIFNTIAVMA